MTDAESKETLITLENITAQLWPGYDTIGESVAYAAKSLTGRVIVKRSSFRMRRDNVMAFIEIGCDEQGIPAEILGDWWTGRYRSDATREKPQDFLDHLKRLAL